MFVPIIQSSLYGRRVISVFPIHLDLCNSHKSWTFRLKIIRGMSPPHTIMSNRVITAFLGGAWPEARSTEILGRLVWVCTSLQFGISCSLVVYGTTKSGLQSKGSSFQAERRPQNRKVSAKLSLFLMKENRIVL